MSYPRITASSSSTSYTLFSSELSASAWPVERTPGMASPSTLSMESSMGFGVKWKKFSNRICGFVTNND